MDASLTIHPDRFVLAGNIERQDDRCLVGGYDPNQLIAERQGLSTVEGLGGREVRPTACRVSVVFE